MKFCEPQVPDREFLQKVMSVWYLFLLNYSLKVCSIIELPLIFLPGWALRARLLEKMQRASLGSVAAGCIAHKKGWAINLGGGFHHAHANDGSGFCVYPDITFLTHYMEQWYGYKRFMIIDLDAHQGNGHGLDHMDRLKFCVFDMYNHYIFPGDEKAKKGITYDINAADYSDDAAYIGKLEEMLPKAFDEFKPDFVIYNAGTDCMSGDPLGDLDVSPQGIIKRDEIVFQLGLETYKVPVVMLLSGGYQKSNAPNIADSIENIVSKFNLQEDFLSGRNDALSRKQS
jgi:histone deacetylase 11